MNIFIYYSTLLDEKCLVNLKICSASVFNIYSRYTNIHACYIYYMSPNWNFTLLLQQTRDKSPDAAAHLTSLIKKLLLIVSRPARLLECLEFDPEEFYHLLEQAEGQARTSQGIKTDIPQYIITKLGLNRDPLAGKLSLGLVVVLSVFV